MLAAAQAEAKLNGAQGRYQIEKENRDELAAQITKCLLHCRRSLFIVGFFFFLII